MFDSKTAFVAFADAIESNQQQLDSKQDDLLKALASRCAGGLKRFPLRGNDFRSNLRACFAERSYITLSAIASAASAESEWALMVQDCWEGSLDELAAIGRLIAKGARAELDDLVNLVVPNGWAGLGQPTGQDQNVSTTTRSRISAAAEAHAAAEPTWLRSSTAVESIGPMSPPEPDATTHMPALTVAA